MSEIPDMARVSDKTVQKVTRREKPVPTPTRKRSKARRPKPSPVSEIHVLIQQDLREKHIDLRKVEVVSSEEVIIHNRRVR